MVQYVSANDRFGLLISAMAHDIGHRGLTNPFLIETQDEVAIRYNDSSPLESMHVATLFELSRRPDHEVFVGLSKSQYRDLRNLIIEAILHTDNQRHFGIVKELQMAYENHTELLEGAEFEFTKSETSYPGSDVLDFYKTADMQKLLQISLLHFCDVSNPMKPWPICQMWANLICDEFFAQGDKEKELGLAVQTLNDRDKCNKPYSQIGFIEFFVGPMVLAFNNLIPPLHFCCVQLTRNAEAWVKVWSEETIPTPDADEQARVLERIVKMAVKNRAVLEKSTASVSVNPMKIVAAAQRFRALKSTASARTSSETM